MKFSVSKTSSQWVIFSFLLSLSHTMDLAAAARTNRHSTVQHTVSSRAASQDSEKSKKQSKKAVLRTLTDHVPGLNTKRANEWLEAIESSEEFGTRYSALQKNALSQTLYAALHGSKVELTKTQKEDLLTAMNSALDEGNIQGEQMGALQTLRAALQISLNKTNPNLEGTPFENENPIQIADAVRRVEEVEKQNSIAEEYKKLEKLAEGSDASKHYLEMAKQLQEGEIKKFRSYLNFYKKQVATAEQSQNGRATHPNGKSYTTQDYKTSLAHFEKELAKLEARENQFKGFAKSYSNSGLRALEQELKLPPNSLMPKFVDGPKGAEALTHKPIFVHTVIHESVPNDPYPKRIAAIVTEDYLRGTNKKEAWVFSQIPNKYQELSPAIINSAFPALYGENSRSSRPQSQYSSTWPQQVSTRRYTRFQ